MARILGLLCVMSVLGCSSSEPGDAGKSVVACRQKAGADTDKDCASQPGKPRKLDCDTTAQTNEAVAAGCVPTKPGDHDVCCATTTSGKAEVKLSACTEPADTLTDSNCVGTAEARKLDCGTGAGQKEGLALGCRPEHPGDATDFDLCCPTHVRGGP